MIPAEQRKAHIQMAIDLDPSEIIIVRQERVEVDGAYKSTPRKLPSQKVRIFRQSQRQVNRNRELAGKNYVLEQFMLASAEGDVKSDDTFEHALYGAFRVAEVVPSISQQTICGYQVRIEKVET